MNCAVVFIIQELMIAATGLNTGLIEDSRLKQRPGHLVRLTNTSDQMALTSPSFAVTQALVTLLAQTKGPRIQLSASFGKNLKSQWQLLHGCIIF